MSENKFKKTPNNSSSLVQTSTMFYTLLLIVSIAGIIWGQENYRELFLIQFNEQFLQDQLIIIPLALGILFVGNYLLESSFPSYQKTRNSIMTMFGDLSVSSAIYISAFSSIAEEMLFRGAILPSAGLIVTSLIFGLLHLGPGGRISIWTIWAFASGLLLGGITLYCKAIYPAIIIHFIYNLVSMILIQRDWKKLTNTQKQIMAYNIENLEN